MECSRRAPSQRPSSQGLAPLWLRPMFPAQEKQGLLQHLTATPGTMLLRALAPVKTFSQARDREVFKGLGTSSLLI